MDLSKFISYLDVINLPKLSINFWKSKFTKDYPELSYIFDDFF